MPVHLVRRDGQAQVRIAAEERFKGDLALQSGQRRAEADVDALAERDMAIGVTAFDVVVLRVRKSLRISS